jgi:hypothetical protein
MGKSPVQGTDTVMVSVLFQRQGPLLVRLVLPADYEFVHERQPALDDSIRCMLSFYSDFVWLDQTRMVINIERVYIEPVLYSNLQIKILLSEYFIWTREG